MNSQIYIFIIFILNGFLIGLLFDIFRIIRKIFKTKDYITILQDIIFWILTAGIILFSIFKFNNGEIRFFIFIGIVLGCMLYLLIFSKVFISSSLFIANIIKRIIYYIIIVPFTFLYKIINKLIFKPFTFLVINFRKQMSKFKLKINKKNKKLKFKKDFS